MVLLHLYLFKYHLYKSTNAYKYVVTADVLFYQTHPEHSARIVYPTTFIIVFPSLIVLYRQAREKIETANKMELKRPRFSPAEGNGTRPTR